MFPIIVKSTVSESMSNDLEFITTQNLINQQWETFETNSERTVLHWDGFEDSTMVALNASGVASISDQSKYSKQLTGALEQAFGAVAPSIEKILNKDLKNTEHNLLISIVLYKAGESITNGVWHRDEKFNPAEFPVTSILYFLHECSAKISFIHSHTKPEYIYNSESFASIETKKNMCVTFANRVLKHRVHDMYRSAEQSGLRGLLTFFYRGPAGIPPTLMSIEERRAQFQTAIDHERTDQEITYIARKISSI